MNKKILVIIPVYNEEKHIGEVIRGIKKTLGKQADILAVNDCSTDRSEEIIRQSGAEIIDLFSRVKYGAVLQTGFKYALRNGYSLVATIDGDGQHDPAYLKAMTREVAKSGSDLVIGSRFISDSGYRMPLLRRAGVRLFSWTIRLLAGRRVLDPTSGYQAFNAKVLALYCHDDYPIDYPDADVILNLLYNQIRIREMAVRMKPNPEKSMHAGLSVVYYALKMFLSIFVIVLQNHGKKKKYETV